MAAATASFAAAIGHIECERPDPLVVHVGQVLELVGLAVATTRSPCASAASAIARPNPLELPVMSQVFGMAFAPFDESVFRLGSTGSRRGTGRPRGEHPFQLVRAQRDGSDDGPRSGPV